MVLVVRPGRRGGGRVYRGWQEQWVLAALRRHCTEEPACFVAHPHFRFALKWRYSGFKEAWLGDLREWGEVLGALLHRPAPGCTRGSVHLCLDDPDSQHCSVTKL